MWRRVGDVGFQSTEAEPGDPLLARVGPLKLGEKYEYRVEGIGEDYYQRAATCTPSRPRAGWPSHGHGGASRAARLRPEHQADPKE